MKKIFLIITSLSIIGFASCNKDDAEIGLQEQKTEHSPPVRKLQNPYSVTNMRKALALLDPQTRNALQPFNPDKLITTTDLYVVYKPKTLDQVDELLLDTMLHFFPFPLDCEIADGYVYREPGLHDSLPDYYYCASPIDRPLNLEIESNVLEELFLPNEGKDDGRQPIPLSGAGMSQELITALVDKAMEITNNLDHFNKKTRAPMWTPAGQITYLDEYYEKDKNGKDVIRTRTIGLRGLKVKATRWFRTGVGFVDDNGNYTCDERFERPADYYIDLSRADFVVYNKHGKNQYWKSSRKGNYNLHFSRSANRDHYHYTTVFRAAYHYCNQNIDGLRRPPQSEFWRAKIRLRASMSENEDINGKFWYMSTGFMASKMIHIYKPQHPTHKVYATTIHELAHSAHWRRDRTLFYNTSTIVQESWARGAEVYLTRKVYPYYEVGYSRGDYTGLVEDLMDPAILTKTSYFYNKYQNNSTKSYVDKVTGYSINQIEDALGDVKTWQEWKINLKKLNNVTKFWLNDSFLYWESH